MFVRRLTWDAWNVRHIARHGVLPPEVEDVCQGPCITREAYAGRIMLIGPTRSGRILAAVLEPQEEQGVYYVVTARSASRRERRLYQQESR